MVICCTAIEDEYRLHQKIFVALGTKAFSKVTQCIKDIKKCRQKKKKKEKRSADIVLGYVSHWMNKAFLNVNHQPWWKLL